MESFERKDAAKADTLELLNAKYARDWIERSLGSGTGSNFGERGLQEGIEKV